MCIYCERFEFEQKIIAYFPHCNFDPFNRSRAPLNHITQAQRRPYEVKDIARATEACKCWTEACQDSASMCFPTFAAPLCCLGEDYYNELVDCVVWLVLMHLLHFLYHVHAFPCEESGFMKYQHTCFVCV